MASSAVFTSGLTYTPGGGGSLTQGIRMAFNYNAVSAGKFDVAASSTGAVAIPFGGVGSALGLIIQNNTDVDTIVKINAAAAVFRLAPGGVLMHWASVAAGASPISAVELTPAGTGPVNAGSYDYILLGN